MSSPPLVLPAACGALLALIWANYVSRSDIAQMTVYLVGALGVSMMQETIQEMGTQTVCAALLLIAAALLLTVYNIRESDRAGAESEEMVVRMESLTADLPERLETEKKEFVPEYKKNPEMEMPTVEVNGQECVGMIEIPALGLKLPVISEWSDAKLKNAPSRDTRTAYLKNKIKALKK